MVKRNLAVVFGGRSSEHDVSCMSVVTIFKAVNTDKYNVYLIGITKDGRWLHANDIKSIEDGSWRDSNALAIISPDTKGELMICSGNESRSGENNGSTYDLIESVKLDVIFPVLHGMYGEDGTIQGLFDMSGIPYVGCGVLSSAVAMDKFYTKIIVDTLGIRQAKYVPVLKSQLSDMENVIGRVEEELSYPVFVKPSKAGSSKGVSKAVDRESLEEALNEAVKHDYKILVEETIVGREIECAVMGHDVTTQASGVGEILAAGTAQFYDFDAKYFNAESKTVIKPELPMGKTEEIRDYAVKIFNAIDGFGLSRVDFFLEDGTDSVVFNEINTLPGFTSISMYPILWSAEGYDIEKLVDTLIDMAVERP